MQITGQFCEQQLGRTKAACYGNLFRLFGVNTDSWYLSTKGRGRASHIAELSMCQHVSSVNL